uniref:C2H2-type domain-containing protein n=1 Tax=Anopheles funestus TaxID=62324 RepID=A0A4Y0BLC8_ANOFN
MVEKKRHILIDGLTQTLAQNNQAWQNVLQQPSQKSKNVKTLKRKKFSCDYCKRKFVYSTGLERHKKKFHADEENSVPDLPKEEGSAVEYPQLKTFDIVLKCTECGEIFPEVKQFEAHTIRYNWELMLMDTSPEDIDIGSMFQKQVFIVTIHTALVCEFCDACFSDYESLFYHEAHHSPASGYACRFCKLNFFKLESVLEHREQCCEYTNFRTTYLLNVPVMYSCNACMSLFSTLPELYEHRYSNHHYFPRRINAISVHADRLKRLWLACELCGATCNHIYALLQHRTEEHSVASPDDGAAAENPPTTYRPTVKRIRSETPKEPIQGRQFLCEQCGKTYTQSSHLWQHLRFHNGVKPFSCNIGGCTRRFTIRPDLNDHIRKCHTGERPYKCDQCNKRFLTGSVFYQHRLIHRNERRHACSECDRRFYRADALKNHQRIHTGEKPYDCPNCDRKFRQRGDREKHIRVKHLKMY